MARFTAVLIEHGYKTSQYERDIIERAGGRFIDADTLPVEEALELCRSAEGIPVRRINVNRRNQECIQQRRGVLHSQHLP